MDIGAVHISHLRNRRHIQHAFLQDVASVFITVLIDCGVVVLTMLMRFAASEFAVLLNIGEIEVTELIAHNVRKLSVSAPADGLALVHIILRTFLVHFTKHSVSVILLLEYKVIFPSGLDNLYAGIVKVIRFILFNKCNVVIAGLMDKPGYFMPPCLSNGRFVSITNLNDFSIGIKTVGIRMEPLQNSRDIIITCLLNVSHIIVCFLADECTVKHPGLTDRRHISVSTNLQDFSLIFLGQN